MNKVMSRNCPKCGIYAPRDITICPCGRKLRKASPATRFPRYFAVPPLLVLVFLVVVVTTQKTPVQEPVAAAESKPPQKPKGSLCVDTSGITLSDSNSPAKGSTVLRGTVLNGCGETLDNVILHIAIRDESGATNTGSVEVFDLKPGIAKQFERAWVGRITTWEITANK